MEGKTLEVKLEAFAERLGTDRAYADEFRAMSRAGQAQELLKQGFTLEDIGSMIAYPDEAIAVSLRAGKFWAP